MGLGPNDCLAIPQKAIGPDRMVLGGSQVQGTTFNFIGRMLSVSVDERKGSFEYIPSAVFGDSWVIRKEGRYSIKFHGISSVGGGWCALTKNLPASACQTSPGTNWANYGSTSNALWPFLLDLSSFNLSAGTTGGHKPGGEFWLVPGDVIRLNVDNNYSSGSCFFSIEYLGGM